MAFKLAAVATRTAAARSGFPPLIGDRERCEPFRLGLPAIFSEEFGSYLMTGRPAR
jgi:hypothetical protein